MVFKDSPEKLLVFNQNLQLEISIGLMKKHPSGDPHQINNTEGWYQNVQFGGNLLDPR
jgi:hypothetical protein